MAVSRRQMLSGSAAAGVGLSVAGVLPSLATPAAASNGQHGHRPGESSGGRPFPPLQDDPHGILALPAGFSYEIVTREGVTEMSSGQGKTPGFHDGTGVVSAGHGKLTIIQNHELTPDQLEFGVPHIPGTVYDPGALNASGCTVITTDGHGRTTAEWVGISGTVRTCAGGVTPWGTWLTCEETFINAGTTWSAGGRRSDLRDRPQHAQQRHVQRIADLLGVHRADVLARRRDPVRQHPGARHHPGHQGPVGEVPRLADSGPLHRQRARTLTRAGCSGCGGTHSPGRSAP